MCPLNQRPRLVVGLFASVALFEAALGASASPARAQKAVPPSAQPAPPSRTTGRPVVGDPSLNATARLLGLQPSALAQLEAIFQEKAARTPQQAKIDCHLLDATRMWNAAPTAAGQRSADTGVTPDMVGRVPVDIRALPNDDLLAAIQNGGGQILSAVKGYDYVRANVSLNALEALAGREDVRWIGPAEEGSSGGAGASALRFGGAGASASASAGAKGRAARAEAFARRLRGALAARGVTPLPPAEVSTDTPAYPEIGFEQGEFSGGVGTSPQGNSAHQAPQARTTYSVTGAGIKIGVLSDGVNYLANSQASGALPAVTVLPGQAGNGAEGTAMLEIVHAIAPGAQLYYASGLNGYAQFAQNIRDLRNVYGCDIILDDVFYYTEAPFQDDLIAKAVRDVVASGAWYFSLALNYGNLDKGAPGVWEGDFRDGGAISFPTANEVGRVHRFDAAADGTYNIANVSSSRFYLYWSDPLGAATNDYDVIVTDATGSTVTSFGTNRQNGFTDPKEMATVAPGSRVYVIAYTGNGKTPAPRALHMTLQVNGLTSRGLKFATSGATKGHGQSPDAFTVAAAPASQQPFVATSTWETFSADGPRRVFLNPNGTPINSGVQTFAAATGIPPYQKPELTAADGVSTTVPGFTTFYGTSAAAPHAGALAALVKSYKANTPTRLIDGTKLTVAEIRALLNGAALDATSAGLGWDRNTGYGFLMPGPALYDLGPGFLDDASVAASGVTPSSATVSWKTTLPSNSVVEYGMTAAYGSTATVATPLTDHSVTLTGLKAGTLYHYRVRSATASGSAAAVGNNQTFVTGQVSGPASIGIGKVDSVTRAQNGSVSVTFTLRNTGGATADAVTLSRVTLGGASATVAPGGALGALAPGGTAQATVTFPSVNGSQVLRVNGGFTNGGFTPGGSFASSTRVSVP